MSTKKNKPAPVIDELLDDVQETAEEVVEEEVTPVVKKKTVKGKVVNCELLNLRKEPSINSDVITVLKAGTEVVIKNDKDPDWYETPSGFVMRKYIKILGE